MEQETQLNRSYKYLSFFSVKEIVGGEGFAQTHFPASGAGSLFQFFCICWEGLLMVIPPQTKIPYKIDSFLPTCFSENEINQTKRVNKMKNKKKTMIGGIIITIFILTGTYLYNTKKMKHENGVDFSHVSSEPLSVDNNR
jgi:hypothetical protein